MTSDESNIRYLENEIKKTGKPLEIRISDILDRRQWKSITNQDTFYDRETRKLREIDVCASDGPARIQNLELEASLIVECKKSEAFSWAFSPDLSSLTWIRSLDITSTKCKWQPKILNEQK